MSNRISLEAFRGQLVTDSVVRCDPYAYPTEGRHTTNGKRRTDGKWVIEALCALYSLQNVRTYTKEQNIRRIIERETAVRRFTIAETPASTMQQATAAANASRNAQVAPAAPAADNNCATINAPGGLVIKKTAVALPAEGFQPYSIRFTVKSQAIATKLKDTFGRANREFGTGRNNQSWLLGALTTAIDANCGCAAAAAPTVASTATTRDGMVVEKVLLPVVGFQPFTLEFQLTTQELATKFAATMRAAGSFCSDADWLRAPISSVMR